MISSVKGTLFWRTVLMVGALLALSFTLLAPASFADPVDPLGSNQTSQTTQAPQQPAPAPTYQQTQPTAEPTSQFSLAPEDNGNTGGNMRDYIGNYNPSADFDPNSSPTANWLIKLVGKGTSIIIWVLLVLFGFITVLDLAYITIPFVRPSLADANENGQGMDLNSMGGAMGGGYGAGGSNNTNAKRSLFNRQWVSDEAIEAVAKFGGASQAQMQGGGYSGMNMMGGMGTMQTGMAPTTDANNRRSVLGTYVKSRFLVAIFLGVAVILLTSGALLGYGMDVGTFILRVIGGLMNMIP